MKKLFFVVITLSTLTACGSVAIMDKSGAVSTQPELIVKTDGDLWGLGEEGTFDISGMYQGKYSRNSSSSTWFDTVSFKDGELAAEITRNDNGQIWNLVCSGGGTSVSYMGVDFGGNKPYRCSVSQNNEKVGEFVLEPQAGIIKVSLEKKEAGHIRVGSIKYDVETVHSSKDLLMSVEKPLGYSFKHGSQEVAAAQTNGMLTLQMLPELNDAEKDTLVIGTIASALSWRPEE
ncbi:Lipoprotein [Vibrio crassostreae]|uniref:hypothetical protein n=1 Tax=Vibrio crassostreae TaxID=246167 RepID=UPI001B30FE43|nr:hypothetical protein [Vibrio crassostreae]CAK3085601.1 Lipoprotein [Vibrio crassostreae]CAK3099532.1 Lipoprotein [Vibrio crassostreae]CAK3105515.1 Lipoprotein [Vibrio crassostreae]CAK3123650.1 Lipoprotein [Vibrio crassostreae]CAK3126261.1 Lipoprotein [Vibrio crassostreae]